MLGAGRARAGRQPGEKLHAAPHPGRPGRAHPPGPVPFQGRTSRAAPAANPPPRALRLPRWRTLGMGCGSRQGVRRAGCRALRTSVSCVPWRLGGAFPARSAPGRAAGFPVNRGSHAAERGPLVGAGSGRPRRLGSRWTQSGPSCLGPEYRLPICEWGAGGAVPTIPGGAVARKGPAEAQAARCHVNPEVAGRSGPARPMLLCADPERGLTGGDAAAGAGPRADHRLSPRKRAPGAAAPLSIPFLCPGHLGVPAPRPHSLSAHSHPVLACFQRRASSLGCP